MIILVVKAQGGAIVCICLNSKAPSSSHLVSNNLIKLICTADVSQFNDLTFNFLEKKSIMHVSPSSSMLHSLINQLREVGMTFDS